MPTYFGNGLRNVVPVYSVVSICRAIAIDLTRNACVVPPETAAILLLSGMFEAVRDKAAHEIAEIAR